MSDFQPMMFKPVLVKYHGGGKEIKQHRPEHKIDDKGIVGLMGNQEPDRCSHHAQGHEDQEMAVDDDLPGRLPGLVQFLIDVIEVLPPHGDDEDEGYDGKSDRTPIPLSGLDDRKRAHKRLPEEDDRKQAESLQQMRGVRRYLLQNPPSDYRHEDIYQYPEIEDRIAHPGIKEKG